MDWLKSLEGKEACLVQTDKGWVINCWNDQKQEYSDIPLPDVLSQHLDKIYESGIEKGFV